MEFTVGRELQKGMKVYIKIKDKEDFSNEINSSGSFRFILVKSGTGIVNVDGTRYLLNAPAILCLNEKEEISLEKCQDITAITMYFYPCAVNTILTYENIREEKPELSQTELNDRSCITPFFSRNKNYNGYIEIGLITANKIEQLLELANREFTGQPDSYWPCRGRSYFLELIIYIYRLYLSPRETENIIEGNDLSGIYDLILYLHTNYNKKITINELTKVFNINRTSLNVMFKKSANTSILSYLIKYRIKVASLLLRDTGIPISEIVERIGFGDMTNFSRMFKKYMECSPSEYRQNNSFLIKRI